MATAHFQSASECIIRPEAVRQVSFKDACPKRRRVFGCRQGLCPGLLQNENSLHSKTPASLRNLSLAKSWICQNKLWKANIPTLIDNLLFSHSVTYRFCIKLTVIILPVYVIWNTFVAVKKHEKNTLTFAVSIHGQTT